MKKQLLYGLLVSSICYASHAQQGTNASGGMATESSGSVSYTIGQIDYSTFFGSNGIIHSGIQQPFEIQQTLGIDVTNVKLKMIAFPNPSNNILNLRVEDLDLKDMRYQLLDIAGRILKEERIVSQDTQVIMSDYNSGNYLLNVIQNSKPLKTFKIVKN